MTDEPRTEGGALPAHAARPSARRGSISLDSPVSRGTPLAERAYVMLRDEIVSLRFAPGAQLDDSELSHAMRMSRTPIREALVRLEGDELVRIMPRRGTFVREVEARDLGQLSEIRAHQESLAAWLAAGRVNEDDRAELERLGTELRKLRENPDQTVLINLDRTIHHSIYGFARNHFLQAALSRYYYLTLRIWFLALDRLPDRTLEEAVVAHLEVLDAIRAGDGEGAARAAREHVVAFEQAIRNVL